MILSHLLPMSRKLFAGDFKPPSFFGLDSVASMLVSCSQPRCALAAVNNQVSFRCCVVTDVDMLVLLAAASAGMCCFVLL